MFFDRSSHNYFLAPEVLKPSGGRCSEEVDLWSVGAILYLCATGGRSGYKEKEKFDFTEPCWQHVSGACRDFVAMLVAKRRRAQTVADVAGHGFLVQKASLVPIKGTFQEDGQMLLRYHLSTIIDSTVS
jgi:serine/threonine protein kinase